MNILSIVTGIIAGLITALVVWLIKKGYLPLIRIFRPGDPVHGMWLAEYDENGKQCSETIAVRQVWGAIEGKATFAESDGSQRIQKFRGAYRNQILTAEYWSKDKRITERGTFTLRREKPNLLVGYLIFYEGTDWNLRAGKYVWRRQ